MLRKVTTFIFLAFALLACQPAFAQRVSTLPGASALTGTEIFPCVQSGVTDGCTTNQMRTLTQTLPSAALVGSPGAGLEEFDGSAFYSTPVASNRGVDLSVHYQSLTGDYTLSNVNTVQKALNGTTNGALTVPASTGYMFELYFIITNTGTSSHTWAVSIAGSATLTSGVMQCTGVSATSSSVAAVAQGYTTTPGTSYVVTSASTSTTENVTIRCVGRLNINTGGTLIPSVQASAAPGGTQTMKAGSSFWAFPIGTNAAVSIGNWN